VRLKGLQAGADDFLNRPMDLAELRLRVKGHLERRRLQEELEELEKTLLVLVRAVEAKDAYTAGHGERVAQYAFYGAEELGASPEELKDLRMGALLHDIGKIGIPDHILRGDHALTEVERSYIRRHPVLGGRDPEALEGPSPPPALRALAPREAGRLRLPGRPHRHSPPGSGGDGGRHLRWTYAAC
jgi:response regulator RpfG family c-di-GMP phosphodiesterase